MIVEFTAITAAAPVRIAGQTSWRDLVSFLGCKSDRLTPLLRGLVMVSRTRSFIIGRCSVLVCTGEFIFNFNIRKVLVDEPYNMISTWRTTLSPDKALCASCSQVDMTSVRQVGTMRGTTTVGVVTCSSFRRLCEFI